MEEQQNKLTEEEYIAQLMAQHEALLKQAEQEAAAPAPTRRARAARGRKRSPYRHGALLLAGMLCYALLTALAALAWGSVLFARQGDVGESALMPLAIFLGAIFFACFAVTLLSRGGTIFPALGLALLVNILPFLLPQAPAPQFKAIAVKLVCTLAVAATAFVLSKLLYIKTRKIS